MEKKGCKCDSFHESNLIREGKQGHAKVGKSDKIKEKLELALTARKDKSPSTSFQSDPSPADDEEAERRIRAFKLKRWKGADLHSGCAL